MSTDEPLRRQSQNLDAYQNALTKLTEMGLTYESFASRKEVRQFVSDQNKEWPRDPDGTPHFPKVARFLKPSDKQTKPTSIRLDMQKALDYLGNKAPKYFAQFHPVRGKDLEASTDIHTLLQVLLGLKRPSYHHHRLVVDADKRKLSKSDGDGNLSHFIGQNMSPAEIFALCRKRLER